MKRQQISQEIERKMPKQLNELEKAAYIMMSIGKDRIFSPQYYFSDKKTRNKIYRNARKKSRINLQNKETLICVTACRLYRYVAERNGLDVYYTGDSGKITKNDLSIFEDGEHVTPVVKLKDGRFIKVDVEWDLENIQTGMRWMKFGTKDKNDVQLSQLSQNEIDDIMCKIGYINDKSDYTDFYLEQLAKKIKDLTTKEKLNVIFNDEKITQIAQKLKGSVEIYRFYRRIIKDFTTKEEGERKTNDYGKNVFCFGSYLKSKSNKKKYTVCVFYRNSEDNDKKIWMWSKKGKKMIEISLIELKHFLENKRLKIYPGKNVEECKELYDSTKQFPRKTNIKTEHSVKEMVI